MLSSYFPIKHNVPCFPFNMGVALLLRRSVSMRNFKNNSIEGSVFMFFNFYNNKLRRRRDFFEKKIEKEK